MAPVVMRSKLFVPGSRPELFAKALAGEADGISFDLEDAVQESRKVEARRVVGDFLRATAPGAPGKVLIVRVNGIATPHFEADVHAIAWPALDLVNLPKSESPEDVRRVSALLACVEAERGIARPIGILANIESPRGLRRAAEIAGADSRVVGLQLGFADLLEPLGIDRTDALAVHHLQLAVRLAAGEAGIWAYDAAYPDVKDVEGYRREAEAARRLGYLGKSCIHPSQVVPANETFCPSAKDLAHALHVVDAAREADAKGIGAFVVDGKMIDAPFVRRAEALLAFARRIGLGVPA